MVDEYDGQLFVFNSTMGLLSHHLVGRLFAENKFDQNNVIPIKHHDDFIWLHSKEHSNVCWRLVAMGKTNCHGNGFH